MTPQDLAEAVLGASRAHHTIAIVTTTSSVNIRWAANQLTTNGHREVREVTAIAIVDGPDGQRASSVTQPAVDADPRSLAQESLNRARRAELAWDAQPLPSAALSPPGHWMAAPAEVSAAELAPTLADLAAVVALDQATGAEHFGYLELTRTSTWLATSMGTALRFDQPAARLELTVKSHQRTRSTWQGFAGADLCGADVAAMAARARVELGWQATTHNVPAGRRSAILSPSAVADLMVDLMWGADAVAATEGRSTFSAGEGATRVGERLSRRPVRLFSDPGLPEQAGAPWLVTGMSHEAASVFDNGLPLGTTDWIADGVLGALVSSRSTAQTAGLALALEPDNLALDAAGSGTLDELIGRTDDALLVTCTWYNRMVDPQTHLITGLTRDGVYWVRDGQIAGRAGNFRFNCSPVLLLDQITDATVPRAALGREVADYFTRTTMPAVRVADFNFSSDSAAV